MASNWEEESIAIHRHKGKRIRRSQWKRRVYSCLAVCVVAYGAMLGWWLWHSGELARFEAGATQAMTELVQASGLTVQRLSISGQRQLSPQMIAELAQIDQGKLILLQPLGEMKARLEAHPQIASAQVTRALPDTLAISIVEQTPVAIWQSDNNHLWLSRDGTVLQVALVSEQSMKRYPVITGADAPEHLPQLWPMLEDGSALAELVVGAQWVGGRRWTVWLKGGVKLMLPVANAEKAWEMAAKWHAENGLMHRAVKQIDLRLANRAYLTLEGGSSDQQSLQLTAAASGAI